MVHAMEICGCAGGMALGFRRAGLEFDLVVDRDADACASYTHNLGHAPLRMDLRDLLRMAESGWHPGRGVLDLLVADPPCQPWSSAGKQQGLGDERDCLRPLMALVAVLLPRAFLLGNVPGLEYENAQAALAETVGALSYRGYCIDHCVLDAADYGVPQRRIRPFWFAHRGGPCITWPTPTHGPPTDQLEIGGTELYPWVTCRQALCDLPLSEIGQVRGLRPPKKNEDGSGHPWSEVDAPARTICARRDGGSGGGDVLKVMEWPWDRPATTVCAENWIPQPGHCFTKGELKGAKYEGKTYQGWRAVVLSERARARLQSFPDMLCGCNGGFPTAEIYRLVEAVQMVEPIDASGRIYRAEDCCETCWLPRRPWRFIGQTKGSRNAQIGMAMPPLLSSVIGRSVKEWFG
jgi:DNA (cytosine-5)-methyltransferase 1